MDAQKIRRRMTLEQKAAFCSGLDFWHLHGVENIPPVMVTDGPHGLRKQAEGVDHLGLNESVKAICFPAGCALACSFDPELAERMGAELGKLAQAEDISAVLGPAMNIKRSPLCGRNFEYYSEDPLLSTKMASGAVKGIQSWHVGACPKHFLANNQEYYRMSSNSVVDEQTMREIYLASFEETVREAKPWTVMCSYNKINGTYACENKTYLTDILRGEWGFDGYVMTDWGALDDPVESLKAGLDLGMPGPSPESVRQIVQAVENGTLNEAVVDQAVDRILSVVLKYVENHDDGASYDYEAGHEAARQIETECAVLLKNEDHVLPLSETENVVMIGQYCKAPRYQGGRSSHINPYRVSCAWDEVGKLPHVTYAQGYSDRNGDDDSALLAEAVEKAQLADKAIIFAGLPDAYETEGVDRKSIDMPENQNRLIAAVAAVQPNTVVVLHNGSAISMPWLPSVKAVLELYLGGEAAGLAAVDLLYGSANPSGRLAETFPLRLEDTPAYPYYGVEKDDVPYREGRLVGYRYYETKKAGVLFPFGHGLSYTTFAYSNLTVDKQELLDTEQVTVTVDVANTGCRAGKDVVQLYIANAPCHEVRPVRELRAFRKVYLEPGETKTVSFTLGKRAFAQWDADIHDWQVPDGIYKIQIGKNARDILLETPVRVASAVPVRVHFTINTPLGDMMVHPAAKAVLEQALGPVMAMFHPDQKADGDEPGVVSDEMAAATTMAMPLRAMLSFSPDTKLEQLEQLVAAVNMAIERT